MYVPLKSIVRRINARSAKKIMLPDVMRDKSLARKASFIKLYRVM